MKRKKEILSFGKAQLKARIEKEQEEENAKVIKNRKLKFVEAMEQKKKVILGEYDNDGKYYLSAYNVVSASESGRYFLLDYDMYEEKWIDGEYTNVLDFA